MLQLADVWPLSDSLTTVYGRRASSRMEGKVGDGEGRQAASIPPYQR